MLRIVCLVVLISAIVVQGNTPVETRAKFMECVHKEIDAAHKEHKCIKDEEVVIFKAIIDDEIKKTPPGPKTDDEKAKIIKCIEEESKKKLKGVETKTIDKMMDFVKEKAMHCAADCKH